MKRPSLLTDMVSPAPLPYAHNATPRTVFPQKVIVTSEHPGLLSSVVFALAALARPLVWVHPIVPVMPMNMREVLSAPVPYLIGEAIDQIAVS